MTERDDESSAPQALAQRADGLARCSGALADLAVADVLQLLQLIGKSAVMTVTVKHGGAQSRLWCSEGSLIDAESGRLRGEAAAYRVLALDEGWLEAELRHEQRQRTIEAPTQRLLLEAARRKDETLALKRKLGDERCCYRLVHEPEPEQLASSSAADLSLLRVLASAPSVGELLAESERGDLETLLVLERWFDAGYLARVGPRPESPASHSATDAALFGAPEQVPSIAPLATSVSPRPSPRSARSIGAAAGAALLAVASFAGGYLLRASTGTTSAGTATSQAASGERLAEPPPDAQLAAIEGSPGAIADGAAEPLEQDAPQAALAAVGPSELAVEEGQLLEQTRAQLPLAERGLGGETAARAQPAGDQTSKVSSSSAPQRPTSPSRATARALPPAARATRAANGPSPTISEPRVRVIGATEPSVRLLD